MTDYKAYYDYVDSSGCRLFTVVMLPERGNKKFPIVAIRDPYVNSCIEKDEDDILIEYLNKNKNYLKKGYAVVYQQCRGNGKSEGVCIPYINERNDSINFLDWIRKQDFYEGEIYLWGQSYLTSVWYTSAPFGDDIKGAVFSVQDYERYNICYRNGFLKRGLHGFWYVIEYKQRESFTRNYTNSTFDTLPLKDFTSIVFGENIEDFDDMLKSPKKTDAFWQTHNGGTDARGATDNVKFPILFTTGFYDIYTGGIFDMWNNMSKETQEKAALVVSPYDHSDGCVWENSIEFEKGKRIEQFGEDYITDWFDYIRQKREKSPFEQGKITYYRLFDNKWTTDDFYDAEKSMDIKLGENEVSYVYNPYDAPKFKGGLSATFGGAEFQDKPNSRHDIISIYTAPFEKDVFVKGKMKGVLNVKSDCEDTCFYMRISIEKEKGDYGLRDDITSLCYQLCDYTPNSYVNLDFSFDEHAFLVKKGERLRIDISSANNEHYVRHTNQKGLYSEMTTAKVARNCVNLEKSRLMLPIE